MDKPLILIQSCFQLCFNRGTSKKLLCDGVMSFGHQAHLQAHALHASKVSWVIFHCLQWGQCGIQRWMHGPTCLPDVEFSFKDEGFNVLMNVFLEQNCMSFMRLQKTGVKLTCHTVKSSTPMTSTALDVRTGLKFIRQHSISQRNCTTEFSGEVIQPLLVLRGWVSTRAISPFSKTEVFRIRAHLNLVRGWKKHSVGSTVPLLKMGVELTPVGCCSQTLVSRELESSCPQIGSGTFFAVDTESAS